jgi:hypothetical protein
VCGTGAFNLSHNQLILVRLPWTSAEALRTCALRWSMATASSPRASISSATPRSKACNTWRGSKNSHGLGGLRGAERRC